MKQNGYAFKYADDRLKSNREYALTMVDCSSCALEYVDEKFKFDKEFSLLAARQKIAKHKYKTQKTSEKINIDKNTILAAVNKKWPRYSVCG